MRPAAQLVSLLTDTWPSVTALVILSLVFLRVLYPAKIHISFAPPRELHVTSTSDVRLDRLACCANLGGWPERRGLQALAGSRPAWWGNALTEHLERCGP